MKKLIFLLMITLAGSSLIAQVDKKAKKPRVYGGVNIARIVGESDSYIWQLPGALLGADVGIVQLTDNLGIDLGLGYSMQGSRYESYQYIPGGESEKGKALVRLNYIVMPVTAIFRTKSRFFAEAGLQPAVLVSAKDKHDGETENIRDLFKGFDIGVIAGVGYETKSKIGVGIRVVPGLTNINKSSGTYGEVKDKNMVVSLRATYQL